MKPDQASAFFGRRLGRPLAPARQKALDELLPVLSIPEDKLTQTQDLDPASLFDNTYETYWMEIGFGSGEHLAAQMERNPDTGFLGAEPFINGMSAFLKDISSTPSLHGSSVQSIDHTHKACDDVRYNVRVLMDDALPLARSLKAGSLERLYILNPDPWHKKRHHKRRIVNPETLDEFARILKQGGLLVISTDVPDLADWMVTHSFNHPSFQWSAKSAKDWRTPPENWVHTRYETKGAKGADQMAYLIFEKISC